MPEQSKGLQYFWDKMLIYFASSEKITMQIPLVWKKLVQDDNTIAATIARFS